MSLIKREREAQRKAEREHDAAMLAIAKEHARNSLQMGMGGHVAMAVAPSAPPKEDPGPDSGVPVASISPMIRPVAQ